MKARPKKPGARSTAAKKPAVARSRSVSAASKRAAAKAAAVRRVDKPAKTRSSKSPVATPVNYQAPTLVATLGADCTIEHAPALHQQLLKMLGERACVTLDVSAVKRCDTAGLQVLVAFVRERREAGHPVELKGATEAFIGPVTLLGLGTALGFEIQAAQA